MTDRLLKRKSNSGVVLIIVLIITAILSILVVDLIYFTQIDYEISSNTREDIKARYIAKSGVHVVAGTMKKKALEELKQLSILLDGQSDESDGYWTLRVPYFPLGGGNISLEVIDERSKINVNALVNPSTNRIDKQVKTEIEELFRMLGVDTNKSDLFISSLINWLDSPVKGAQNDQDSSGASGDFYEGLENPYSIKDGPLDSLAEIRLINGMDPEFYDTIKDYVTVYPSDKKVNFSTASKVVMMSALKGATVPAIEGQEGGSPGDLPDDVAERIADSVIEERKDDPTVKRKELKKIVKTVDPNLKISSGMMGTVYATGKSDVFSVKSSGSFGEGTPTISIIEAVVRKSGSKDSANVEIISWKER